MLLAPEPGLVSRLLNAGAKPTPAAIRPVLDYLFHRKPYRDAVAALKEAGMSANDAREFLSDWLARNAYTLTQLRRAIRRVVLKRVTVVQAAWQHKVKARDLRLCMASLSHELREELKARRYYKPMSRRTEDEIHRLLLCSAQSLAWRRTRFLWQARLGEAADPSLTKEDIVAELMLEVGRVLRWYDFDPVKHCEVFTKSGPTIRHKLRFQPVERIVSVKVEGDSGWSTVPHTLIADKIIINEGRGATRTYRVVYYHHMQALNYGRKAVNNGVSRIISHHTSQSRARTWAETDGAGNTRFVFRTRSLDKPVGEDAGSRLLHETVECPISSSEQAEAMSSESVIQAAALAGPGAVRFVKIVALDLADPEFDQWCVARGVDRDRLSPEKVAAEAKEFLELDDATLNRLRHAAFG